MLGNIDLTHRLPKRENKVPVPGLHRRRYDRGRGCWEAKMPRVIVFEGWDAAGKGTSINTPTSRLDPRGFGLSPIQEPRTFETHLPWLWRFWRKLPNYGQMAILECSWYCRVLGERVEDLTPARDRRKDAPVGSVRGSRLLGKSGSRSGRPAVAQAAGN